MDKSVADLKLKLESANANLKQYQVEEQILNDIVTSAFKGFVFSLNNIPYKMKRKTGKILFSHNTHERKLQ